MKKIISILMLIIVLSVGVILASCQDSDDKKANVDSALSGQNSETETKNQATYPAPNLPNVTYSEDDNFSVLVRKSNGGGCDDIFGEVDSGDTLKEAIYLRNMAITDKYGLTVQEIEVEDGEVDQFLYNSIAANEIYYDVIDVSFRQAFNASTNDLLYNLKELDYLDLSNPWWDAQMNEDITIGGSQYYAIGNANITATRATWCLMYNQKLLKNMGYEDGYLYNLVRDGKWTLDEYYNIVKGFSRDLNNDNLLDYNDQFGLAGNGAAIHGFMSSAGLLITKKNADDYLEFVELDDRTNDLLIKLSKCIGPTMTYDADYYGPLGHSSANLFKEDKAVFFSENFITMEAFRDMEADYGIIPHPKYSLEDDYSSYVHEWVATTFAVPITAPDLTKTAVILEYMSYISTDMVLPIYYNRVVEGKNSRDAESYEMITEYIIPKRKYDIGFSNLFGNLYFDIYFQINDGMNAFASTYKRSARAAMQDVNAANEAFGG